MSNRTRKLIICALVLVVAAAAIVLILQNKKDEGPAKLSEPIAVDVSLKLNRDGVNALLSETGAINESSESLVTAVEDLVDEMTFHVTKDGTKSAMDLLLKDTNLLNVSLEQNEKTMNIVTDLLSDTMLSLNMEELTGGQSSISMPDTEQLEKMKKVSEDKLNELEAKFKAALGDEEKGDWTFDGQAFTARRPVNLTTKELLSLVLDFSKDFLSDETVSSWITTAVPNFSLDRLDEAKKNMLDTPDEDMPAITAWQYVNGSNTVYEASMTQNDKTLSMYLGTVKDNYIFFCEMPGTLKIDAKMDVLGYTQNLTAEITPNPNAAAEKIMIVFAGTTEKSGESTGTAAVSYRGTDLVTLTIRIAKGTAVTTSFDPEGKTVLTAKDLSDGSAMQTLSGKAMTGVLRLMQKASEVMPDQISLLSSLIMGGGF